MTQRSRDGTNCYPGAELEGPAAVHPKPMRTYFTAGFQNFEKVLSLSPAEGGGT